MLPSPKRQYKPMSRAGKIVPPATGQGGKGENAPRQTRAQ